MKKFKVTVRQTWFFFDDIEVEANNENEARKAALDSEDFECDWSRADNDEANVVTNVEEIT